jgi:WD40 repeat protein
MKRIIILKTKLLLILTISLLYSCSFLDSGSKIKESKQQKNNTASNIDTSQSISDGVGSDGLIKISSDRARKSFGTFILPGISLNRWNNSKDIAAWRETNQPLVTLQSSDDVIHDIGVSKNSGFMASVGAKINIWDLDTLTLIRSWELDSVGREIKLTPDGKTLISVHEDNTVKIWQQETGFNTAILEHPRSISAIAISRDGARIASADVGGNISIWDTITGKKLYSVDDILRVNTLQFSNDGLSLASSGIATDDVNYTVQIWETRFYTLEISLPGHRSVVNNVSFSPDGKYIATASRDNTIKVWDVRVGNLFKTLKGHTDDVVKTVFSGDGHWLLSSSLDNKIRIWSFPDGRTIKVLNVPYLRSKTLEYVPNRNWVMVVSGGDQTIQIWASSGFTYKPWDDIRKSVDRLYRDRQRVLNVPFIPKPQLPSLTNLKKDPFESQLTFVNRAARVYGQRINRQIVEYRNKVDRRNKRVALLRQNQQDSRKLVNKQIRSIAIRTTKKTLGETILFPLTINNKPAYDPDRQIMKIRVSFTRAFYRSDFFLKMPEGLPARVFYEDLIAGKIIGNASFDFISDSRVRLSRITVRWRGRTFTATPIRKSSGFNIIPSELRDATISANQLEFQRYGIPYTNFNDFIRTILRQQLKNDLEAQKETPTIDKQIQKNFLENRREGN